MDSSSLHIIKNFDEATRSSGGRKDTLTIVESGLQAINTERVIKQNIKLLDDTKLGVGNLVFDLNLYERVIVMGVGKAACDGVIALNDILHEKISEGIVVDIKTAQCENPNIKFYQGSHPKPTPENILAAKEIMEVSKTVTERDLIIFIVSGGGSSLLCSDEKECDASDMIFDMFLKTGGNINELNVLRKHISVFKGGGFAKMMHPATIIGLIFSDIPGGQIEDVASGPTFKDNTSLEDVKNILQKFNLNLSMDNFTETAKQDHYFEKVTNILLVSSEVALEAMQKKAAELGYNASILSHTLLDDAATVAKNLTADLAPNTVRLSGGEPSVKSPSGQFGKGGRSTHLALEALSYIDQNTVFAAVASDGVDNGTWAGAIVDSGTMRFVNEKGFDYEKEKDALNSQPVFEATGDLLITNPTGSNVADLMVALKGE